MCNVEAVIKMLLESGKTVATAESCTGGMLGAAFTDYPGVSSVYLEGVITYANEAKMRLGVSGKTLQGHGAVSHETAREMAECVRKRAGADIGLSTTGIAGPGGGSDYKPVGLVYVGLSTENGTKSFVLRLAGDRLSVRQKTVSAVFQFLLEELANGQN